MNEILQRELGLDEVVVCPHDDGDRCKCRKPRRG
jgi:histidinol phosphatase-like enzyme